MSGNNIHRVVCRALIYHAAQVQRKVKASVGVGGGVGFSSIGWRTWLACYSALSIRTSIARQSNICPFPVACAVPLMCSPEPAHAGYFNPCHLQLCLLPFFSQCRRLLSRTTASRTDRFGTSGYLTARVGILSFFFSLVSNKKLKKKTAPTSGCMRNSRVTH